VALKKGCVLYWEEAIVVGMLCRVRQGIEGLRMVGIFGSTETLMGVCFSWCCWICLESNLRMSESEAIVYIDKGVLYSERSG